MTGTHNELGHRTRQPEKRNCSTVQRSKERMSIEPRHEKTCLQDFRPVRTQTGLLS